MTNEVFLDTAYAIALSVESDEYHERAEELADSPNRDGELRFWAETNVVGDLREDADLKA